MSGRKHPPSAVDSSTGTITAIGPYREAKELWEMDKAFDPSSAFADIYKEVLEDERVFHQTTDPKEQTKDLRNNTPQHN